MSTLLVIMDQYYGMMKFFEDDEEGEQQAKRTLLEHAAEARADVMQDSEEDIKNMSIRRVRAGDNLWEDEGEVIHTVQSLEADSAFVAVRADDQ